MTRGLEHLLIGRALGGRYHLEAVLGRGGMSIVYRARDRTLGRAVALKLIQHPPGADEVREMLRRRLRREAASAARIPPHRHVVRVYDSGTDPELDLDYIVMELLEGRDLRAALEREPPPPGTAARILLQAAEAIAAGHRVGVIHRDIKPGNIFLVAPDGEVRVLDFGIAKVLEAEGEEELTIFGHAPHSPAYASPEQTDPERSVTAASDVYQLGLVGYELLAGARPYPVGDRGSAAAGVTDPPVPSRGRWASTPQPLRRVIERTLRPDPTGRFPDAGAFAQAWQRAAVEAGLLPREVLADTGWGPAATVGEHADKPNLPPPLSEDEHDRTIAVEDQTLYAPEPAGPPAPEGVSIATGEGIPYSHPTDPRMDPPAPRRRTPRQLLRPGVAGGLLILVGLTWAAVRILDRDPPSDPQTVELEETFRELQSDASRELERAGIWER